MRIERSGDGHRTALANRNPRPDGISRRVASAAREDQVGRAPMAVRTGWHRRIFDYPPLPASAQTAESTKPLHQLGRVGEVHSAPVRRMSLTLVVAGLMRWCRR